MRCRLFFVHDIIVCMKGAVRKTIRITLASLLFVLGIAGLVLPILNGTLFIVFALLILSLEIPALEERLDRIGTKHKKVHPYYTRWKGFIKKYF